MREKGMETFLAVAMSRTLGEAARLLNVTQSTISYNLNELENELGMILVDRQKGVKSAKLTPAGESFLPLARKWQDVSREIENARAPSSAASLSVGGTEIVNCRLLPPVCAALLSRDPPVCLRVATGPDKMLYRAVDCRALDAAIVTHEESARYARAEAVFSESFVVVSVPGEAGEETAEPVKAGGLDRRREFYIEWSRAYSLWHDRLWDPSAAPAAKADSPGLAARLMRRAGEWCIAPESARELFAREVPGARFRALRESPPELVYYKLTHKSPKAASVEALAVFDDALKRRAAALAAKKEGR